jgi:hypothetical protein
MGQAAEIWTVIAVAGVAANLPFLNERLFLLGPRHAPKALPWRLLEWLCLGLLTLGLGMLLEQRTGQRQPQNWEFYAAAACLFAVFAFPGFVWRYLRRGRAG